MKADSNTVETALQPIDTNLPAVPIHLETPPAATPAESVKFDLGMAKKCGALTLAYLARAGWKLACEKQALQHGEWKKWCKEEVAISWDTADRYIKFYYSTVGEHLRSQGTAHRLVENLTDKMIEEATAGLESKTATGAMIELGIVKRPPGWGGERAGAGRKAGSKNVPHTDAELADRDWKMLAATAADSWTLESIPLLDETIARAALSALVPLVTALKRRVGESA